jgi:hypothetical protein
MEDRLGNEYNGMMSIFPHSCDENPNRPCLVCCGNVEAYQKACGVFEHTASGIVQHVPCPYCGEWNCSHNDSTAPVRHVVYPSPEVARRLEELTAQLRKSLDEGNSFEQRPSPDPRILVPGPFKGVAYDN